MKIYFIRHGETVWNTLKIFQGSSNSPLTEKGILQAKKLGKRLENIEFNKFYSSPLGRAIQTSKYIIGDRDIEIIPIKELQEISVGKMEGVNREIFLSTYPEEYEKFFSNSKDYNPVAFDGESFVDFLKRVEDGIKKIVNAHNQDDVVAVVTHGVTLKGILKIVKNIPFEDFKNVEVPENTSLTIVNYSDGKFTIELFSDTSHLDGEK